MVYLIGNITFPLLGKVEQWGRKLTTHIFTTNHNICERF